MGKGKICQQTYMKIFMKFQISIKPDAGKSVNCYLAGMKSGVKELFSSPKETFIR